MGAGGVGIADAVDDGQVALVVEFLQHPHTGMKGQFVVDPEHFPVGNAHGRPVVPIQGVGVGDDGVQVVVAAGKLQHHQDRVFLVAGHSLSP